LHFIEESTLKGEGRIEEIFESMEISKEMEYAKRDGKFSEEAQIGFGENANPDTGDSNWNIEGYVVLDHYETYLKTLQLGQKRMELTVAKRSHIHLGCWWWRSIEGPR
jgi:hypothetical protein